MVIDDDPLIGDGVLRAMLQKDGHQVAFADGGEAGISLFGEAQQRGEPFDVVFTDLGMPYLDGRQVACAIKAESPRTPVILLTGWGTQLQAAGDLPANVDVVLGKPPQMIDLRRAIAKVMDGRAGGLQSERRVEGRRDVGASER
jgi:CheY-like chemotaxis protein